MFRKIHWANFLVKFVEKWHQHFSQEIRSYNWNWNDPIPTLKIVSGNWIVFIMYTKAVLYKVSWNWLYKQTGKYKRNYISRNPRMLPRKILYDDDLKVLSIFLSFDMQGFYVLITS